MSLRFQNVTGSPPIKEILTFRSHSGAQHTIFSNPGTILLLSPRRALFTLWFALILKLTKTRVLSGLSSLGPGGTSVVVVRSDGGWER